MPSTNGHGLKRAILYARVSTQEQAEHGYSLAQQIDALRAHAAREGYEVLEEVVDGGYSGASLERPGMDRVRDLVEGTPGGVSVVLAQDADRISREPIHRIVLDGEMERFGTRLIALDDWGDDSHEGELLRYMKGWVGKGERLKLTERMRRGRVQKVREGKLLAACPRPKYGFRYDATRTGYEVDDERMRVVERIFRLLADGGSIHGAQDALEREGVPAPSGGKRWSRTTIRNIVLDDCYRPHTTLEIEGMVSPGVAAALNPEKAYGVSWWGRRKTSAKPETRRGSYRKLRNVVETPRDEWVAIPITDSGIPREIVDAARAGIKDNKKSSSAGGRFWELSSGILVCAGCGSGMVPEKRKRSPESTNWRIYYRCSKRRGIAACEMRAVVTGEDAEAEVWEFVSGYLKDPDRLREGLDRMIEAERKGTHGDPAEEVKAWLKTIAEVDRKRSRYQDMAAEELISLPELRTKLAELEGTREVAEQELGKLESRMDRIVQLETDKAELLESFAGMIPECLEALTSEKRHRIYKRLRLKVSVGPGRKIEEVRGVFVDRVCTEERTNL